ncbi:fumarate hydratase [Candidatus Bipolaricaulota bacterium]|nr:fumarate hydratase [Candidatus Bipolaricaulota bacterium]
MQAVKQAATILPSDVVDALKRAEAKERSDLAKGQLSAILKNCEIARTGALPICQDTGIQTFFVEAGMSSPYLAKLRVIGAFIAEATAEATVAIPLRPNTVDPFTGKNPGDNLGRFMPYINWELVDGDEIMITLLPKGGGSENMSALMMLTPGVGMEGLKEAVVDHVVACGGKPCPPTIVGLGIGGGADIALKLAKRALLRDVGSRHPEPVVASLEGEILELLNMSGLGPMGIGGVTTALAVHVEYAFRHPAALPLGIVLQCWADRRAKVRITADGRVEVI